MRYVTLKRTDINDSIIEKITLNLKKKSYNNIRDYLLELQNEKVKGEK